MKRLGLRKNKQNFNDKERETGNPETEIDPQQTDSLQKLTLILSFPTLRMCTEYPLLLVALHDPIKHGFSDPQWE